jgi:hypothetical protein
MRSKDRWLRQEGREIATKAPAEEMRKRSGCNGVLDEARETGGSSSAAGDGAENPNVALQLNSFFALSIWGCEGGRSVTELPFTPAIQTAIQYNKSSI